MKNRYGVDVGYFEKWIKRSLSDLSNYKPDELARELARMARTADSEVLREPEFNEPLRIGLGFGDKLVTDIYDPEGEWAGIAISNGNCPVGEFADIDAKTEDELAPILTIKTSNSKSLDVIIQACKRAKKYIKD